MKKVKINQIYILTIALIAMVLLWLITRNYLRAQAVQGCMEVSSYTYNNPKDGVTTVEPIEKSYTKCLELKGYK